MFDHCEALLCRQQTQALDRLRGLDGAGSVDSFGVFEEFGVADDPVPQAEKEDQGSDREKRPSDQKITHEECASSRRPGWSRKPRGRREREGVDGDGMSPMSQQADQLVTRMLDGDRTALAKLMTVVENREPATAEVMSRLHGRYGTAYSVGLTGPPGAGKSTLLDQLVAKLRHQGKRVGIVAVDPSA